MLAKQYNVREAFFGMDLPFNSGGTCKQNTMLTHLAQIHSNIEVPKIAAFG